MFVIASNMTTRDPEVRDLFREWWQEEKCSINGKCANDLTGMVASCLQNGANAVEINLQQHDDRPEAMQAAVKLAQSAGASQLCLSSNRTEVLKAGLEACQNPPIVNYISLEESRLKEIFPLVQEYKAKVVFLVSDPASPADSRDMMEKAAILVGAANDAGIKNDRIIIDPGMIHITLGDGQRHLQELQEVIRSLPETFDPSVQSTCWVSNASSGAPGHLRPVIESTLLPMLAGWGISSVFLDVMELDNIRALHLIKVFTNESVYAQSDVELKDQK